MSKTILITGAGSGIGNACMEYYQANGWNVVGVDINSKKPFNIDVSSSRSIKTLSNYLKENGVKLDAIINNAAVQVEKKLLDTDESEWDHVIDTNLKSVYLVTKFMAELLNKNTSIVNISSVHAKITSIGLASYAASKGGVSALTRAMSLELGSMGVRVNAILPGAVKTPMLKKGLSRNTSYEQGLNKLIKSSPLSKIGEAQDIAKLAYFLTDNNLSSNITGQEFISDSGVSAKLASE